jgi:hypothetical protein
LDIYIASRARNLATVERFIDDYVDRTKSEYRGSEELMMIPLNATASPDRVEAWDWEPARTLTHIIKRGLDKPYRAFSVRLETRDPSLSSATLAFTTDDQLILGLSIDDEGAVPENASRAKLLLHKMAAAYAAERGWIGVEMPPPLRRNPDQSEIVIYDWSLK